MAQSNGAWSFHKTRAELCCRELTGQVDVSHPESGLNRLSIGTGQLSGHILAVRPSSSEPPDPKQVDRHTRGTSSLDVADSYVRGCDLVATYEPRDDWPYITQIYWSAPVHETTDQRLGSLSLFVSLHTHLLDTWPRLCIESLLETDEAFFLTDDAGIRTA